MNIEIRDAGTVILAMVLIAIFWFGIGKSSSYTKINKVIDCVEQLQDREFCVKTIIN